MINYPEYVVVGLGITGLSVARYLTKRNKYFAVMDSRKEPPHLAELEALNPFAPVILGKFDHEFLINARYVIVSPGVALDNTLLQLTAMKGGELIGDIELFAREAQAPVIGITGTNGKSTVTTLVGEMLKTAGFKVKVGGNLGIPALDLLDDDAEIYVLELSSFQLESTYSLQCLAACILNFSINHLDQHPDLESYLRAKRRIFNDCHLAVIPADEPCLIPPSFTPEVITFSSKEPEKEQYGICMHQGENYLACGDKPLVPVSVLKIKGLHNALNALAAMALVKPLKLPFTAIESVLKTFSGLPHRCQWVREINGVQWYNDSKATTVGATKAAIIGFAKPSEKRIILIAGGIGKGQDFSPLTPVIKENVKALITLGRDGNQIAVLADKAIQHSATSLKEAVDKAQALADPGDIVLFSPVCASYDMFKNFMARGDAFMDEVNKL